MRNLTGTATYLRRYRLAVAGLLVVAAAISLEGAGVEAAGKMQTEQSVARIGIAALGVQLRDLRAGYRLDSQSYCVNSAAGAVIASDRVSAPCPGCMAGYTVHYVRPAHIQMWDPYVISSTLRFGSVSNAHAFFSAVVGRVRSAYLIPHYTAWCDGVQKLRPAVADERIGFSAAGCEGGGVVSGIAFRRGIYLQSIYVVVPGVLPNPLQTARDSGRLLAKDVDQRTAVYG